MLTLLDSEARSAFNPILLTEMEKSQTARAHAHAPFAAICTRTYKRLHAYSRITLDSVYAHVKKKASACASVRMRVYEYVDEDVRVLDR